MSDVSLTSSSDMNNSIAKESNVIQVESLLQEIVDGLSSDPDQEEWIQQKLSQLRTCILDDTAVDHLKQVPKRMCAYEFKPGDIAWNCKWCQVDETCVMCNDCFIASDHEHHEVFFYYTHSGGCCDCGDTEAWSSDGFCSQHKGAHDADPLASFSPSLLVSARAGVAQVVSFVLRTIIHARQMVILHQTDLERVSTILTTFPSQQRYAVLIHYNDLKNSHEFAQTLTHALPSMTYQVLKIMQEITVQKQSMIRSNMTHEEALEMVATLQQHGIVSSIVVHQHRIQVGMISLLLQWLVSLANISDGLCRLVCEPFMASQSLLDQESQEIFPVLRAVILADSFLPKTASDTLHSLLMSLLADPLFKRGFAIAFTRTYRQLYAEFVAGRSSASTTILAFSVQFFNRASFVQLLVQEYDLLQVLMTSVLETLQTKPKNVSTQEITWTHVRHVLNESMEIDPWDIFAMNLSGISATEIFDSERYHKTREDALTFGFSLRSSTRISPSYFLSLQGPTLLPGGMEIDVTSPVFTCRRYGSGQADLRYALQIENISECFIMEKNGARLSDLLLYLCYIQGVCGEKRQFGDHVEIESRGWVVAVEFVSTASEVFSCLLANVFKKKKNTTSQWRSDIITKLTCSIMETYYFWLASSQQYFPSSTYQVGQPLQSHPVERSVSCHYPLHRTLCQLIRVLCNSSNGLQLLYTLLIPDETSLWIHHKNTPIGFWHRVLWIEPVLQAIVWDAEVHCNLWRRNGNSVLNHSINYGEPSFSLRFRDVDLLLIQFGFQLMDTTWMIQAILTRYGIVPDTLDFPDLMLTECLTLLCQLASELPPRIVTNIELIPPTTVRSSSNTAMAPSLTAAEDMILRSLLPYLRREIVQRLIVGPCAHSDLSKIASEFFANHENLFENSFSSALVLDTMLKEICMGSFVSEQTTEGSGRVQYRLKSDLYAEYNPTFVHLTRKQHESAHENWFQYRLRTSKMKQQLEEEANGTQSSWLDFPIVNSFLPCAYGFQITRCSILHESVRTIVYQGLWRAMIHPQTSLNVLSRIIHLFTLQIYVIEEIRYAIKGETFIPSMDKEPMTRDDIMTLHDSYMIWITSFNDSRPSVFSLLLELNPWLPNVQRSRSEMLHLDGDQKHELGRGVDWLVHRLARLQETCQVMLETHVRTRRLSNTDEDRKAMMIKKRKEAQIRAMEQMQARQAMFAEQMRLMMGDGEEEEMEDEESTYSCITRDSDVLSIERESNLVEEMESLPECAMCHSMESENSFMCYVGFAQCSSVFSRLNGGLIGRYLSTPMDEMHIGQDVPVHIRLCGHSVHHSCWASYHASQFQRAITGGHHRHALNAVDVTKKEFLCPLCKSISNVLIPSTTEELERLLPKPIEELQTYSRVEMMQWINMIQQPINVEHKPFIAPFNIEINPRIEAWLEHGLSSLCMAIHKVACGAAQKSRPDRYTSSGCLALFHSLMCTFLGSPDHDPFKTEQRFVQAMRLVPLMLYYVTKHRPSNSMEISHLLAYGGSDILPDGTIVLEEEHPSTQLQTRKQSQWGKVRYPIKPLLLSHLGSLLVKGILLSQSEAEAVYTGRLIVLARLIQTMIWYSLSYDQAFTDGMTKDVEATDDNIEFFINVLFTEKNRTIEVVMEYLEKLRRDILGECNSKFGPDVYKELDTRRLLNIVVCEMVPIMKVTAFLLQSRFGLEKRPAKSVTCVTQDSVKAFELVQLDMLWSLEPGIDEVRSLIKRWIHRFIAAYDEMSDPQLVLQQWLTSVNTDKPASSTTNSSHAISISPKIDFSNVLIRDLNTHHTAMSVYVSGSNRTKFLRMLPHAYVKFYAALAKRKCQSCNQFPARPAVCLVCGMLLCAANTCPATQIDKTYPEEANPGACTVHAKKCGRGSCMFMLVLEGAVLLVYWKLAAYVGGLYVDEYGEEFGERNRELNKGRPLYLNAERRDRLLRLWMRHEIPNEVVRIQNNSDRVIRNSHY